MIDFVCALLMIDKGFGRSGNDASAGLQHDQYLVFLLPVSTFLTDMNFVPATLDEVRCGPASVTNIVCHCHNAPSSNMTQSVIPSR